MCVLGCVCVCCWHLSGGSDRSGFDGLKTPQWISCLVNTDTSYLLRLWILCALSLLVDGIVYCCCGWVFWICVYCTTLFSFSVQSVVSLYNVQTSFVWFTFKLNWYVRREISLPPQKRTYCWASLSMQTNTGFRLSDTSSITSSFVYLNDIQRLLRWNVWVHVQSVSF